MRISDWSSDVCSSDLTGANLLVAIFGEKDSHAVYYLNQQDVSRLDVVNYLSHGIARHGEGESAEMEDLTAKAEAAEAETKGDALTEFAVNLNVLAQEGRIDPLVGRGAEVERTIQVLCRRRKNNPLYVGEAGVGKTALAEGLARRIVRSEEHTSELQSLMRISYAVFCLKKKKKTT